MVRFLTLIIFGRKIPLLLDGCHIIFNDSRVIDARLLVELANNNKVELMLLDLGNIDPTLLCEKHIVPAIIRSELVSKRRHHC